MECVDVTFSEIVTYSCLKMSFLYSVFLVFNRIVIVQNPFLVAEESSVFSMR